MNCVFISRSAPTFTVRKATAPHQIKFACDWGRNQENWPGGEYDYEVYFAMAPDGCYYGVLGNEKICYVQAVAYGDTKEYWSLGGLIVKKEFRGHGYGFQISRHVQSEIPKTCIKSISAVLQMEEKYQKQYGYQAAWDEFSYSFDAQKIADLSKHSAHNGINVVHYKEVPFVKLVE